MKDILPEGEVLTEVDGTAAGVEEIIQRVVRTGAPVVDVRYRRRCSARWKSRSLSLLSLRAGGRIRCHAVTFHQCGVQDFQSARNSAR
ncbi:hypothetical protein GCM10010094_73290 [Streptomyces flaveus]|uniref:Uncharacterized protein n=1 Tax=Streptomyces flaveus TaxID=66370 RepID=A0A917VPJ3_9ACTN|nr:hypothetical protein GCM10010094_73290 [Streptomyces flaveus]